MPVETNVQKKKKRYPKFVNFGLDVKRDDYERTISYC